MMWRILCMMGLCVVCHRATFAVEPEKKSGAPHAAGKLDVSAWGDDHVGKGFPNYITGDECLFCHRDVGAMWVNNRHELTIRRADRDDPALIAAGMVADGKGLVEETELLMGDARMIRLLKRSKEYGRLDMFTAKYLPATDGQRRDRDILTNTVSSHWDTKTFGDRCAGCHTTAVDSADRAFSATSIDCFACHGAVDLGHTKDPKLVLLSKEHRDPRQVISICGQCHLRGGVSKSSTLPYPNTFVAGDNLFRDYDVDLSVAAIKRLSPIDRHIFENARDVVVFGRLTTCLSCHDVHRGSTEKHQAMANDQRCATCHIPGSGNTVRESLVEALGASAHNQVCDY